MKKLIIKIGNETHELPYNGETFSFEVEEKYVPKVGDCVMINWREALFFKVVPSEDDEYINSEHRIDLYNGEYTINLGDYSFLRETNFTQITPEELKAKYAEAGYDWDYESDTVKPLKWMPKYKDTVWHLTELLEVDSESYYGHEYNECLLKKGLLFPTEAECQKFADHCLKYFDKK